MTDAVHDALQRELWPWPLAVAYTPTTPESPAALKIAVEVLAEYTQCAWPVHEITASWAMESVASALGAKDHRAQNDLLRERELPIRRAIEAGKVESWGRRSPGAELSPIPPTSWIGGGVVYQQWCNLIPEHWLTDDEEENFFGVSFTGKEPPVWYYDIWVSRGSMFKAFGDHSPLHAPEASSDDSAGQQHAWPTSTARAILDCEQWLRAQFQRSDTSGLAKPALEARALELFEGRLSGRGFKKAWDIAAQSYPEGRKAGAKKKSSRPNQSTNN